jgi:CheY-like chemotaxis protein
MSAARPVHHGMPPDGSPGLTRCLVHVLLIDDEPAIVEMVDIGLTAMGHRVTTADDGAHAVGLLEQVRPDIVLLDFMMPGMDGLSVLENIGRAHDVSGAVPVVMCSARSGPQDALRALAAGATAYLLKPIDIDVLAQTLEEVARESPAQRELRRARALADLRAYSAGPDGQG